MAKSDHASQASLPLAHCVSVVSAFDYPPILRSSCDDTDVMWPNDHHAMIWSARGAANACPLSREPECAIAKAEVVREPAAAPGARWAVAPICADTWRLPRVRRRRLPEVSRVAGLSRCGQ